MNCPRTGVLLLAGGSRALECTLQRASASGAQVKVEPDASVPQHLELHDGTSQRAATVVWRTAGRLGIRFDDYFWAR
jgi:hypothetical protein